MKILIITKNYTPSTIPDAKRFSGISKYLRQEGHDVTIITETTQNKPNEEGIDIRTCLRIGRDSYGMVERLINHSSFMIQSILKSFFIGKVDVVISTSPPLFNLISGRIISKLKKSKYIIDLRDIWPDVFEQTEVLSKNSIIYKNFDRIAKKSYKSADVIAVVTPGKKTLISNTYPEYSDKIELLSNGFNKSILDYSIDTQLAENFNNYFNIIYTGKIGLAQDLDSFVSLAEKYKNIPGYKFHIFGSGRGEQELISSIKEKDLNNIVFYGYRSEQEITTALRLSQISYVSLSNDKLIDSIPSKLYESLVFGCPVLLSAVGDSADLVNLLGYGMTSKPNSYEELEENFEYMINNYDKFQDKKDSVFEYMINNYSRDVTAAKYENIIRRLNSL